MADGKPSPEQLELYYKTSRKYFDELAKQYYANDRDFYNKNFAQYYSPLKNLGTKPKKILAVVFAIMGLIAGVGVVSYFLLDAEIKSKHYSYKKSSEDESNARSIENKKMEDLSNDELDSMNLSYMKSDFEKGTYFYNNGEYDKAKPYFEKVQKSDKDYQFARDVLKAIERKRASQNSARKKAAEKVN